MTSAAQDLADAKDINGEARTGLERIDVRPKSTSLSGTATAARILTGSVSEGQRKIPRSRFVLVSGLTLTLGDRRWSLAGIIAAQKLEFQR